MLVTRTATKDNSMKFMPSEAQLSLMEKLALSLVPKAPRVRGAPKKKAATEITEKGRRVLAYVKAHFGDTHWKGLGKILGVVLDDPKLDEELTEAGDDGEDIDAEPSIPGFWNRDTQVWTAGAAVVPLSNENGHDYDLKQVVIMAGTTFDDDGEQRGGESGFMLQADGSFQEGNSLGYGVGEWRPATATEIKTFFKTARANLGKGTAKLPW